MFLRNKLYIRDVFIFLKNKFIFTIEEACKNNYKKIIKYLYLKKVSEWKKEIVVFYESNEKLCDICNIKYDFAIYQNKCAI